MLLREGIELLITITDYQRIYGIAHAVLKSEGADTNKSCTFYNYCGAYILNEHFKLNAKVYSGFAAYHLGVENVLGFGSIVDGHLSASPEEFHSWVEVDGWLIDFMAPEFPSIMLSQGCNESIPRKMIQSKLDSMAIEPDAITSPGDFLVLPDMEVTRTISDRLESNSTFTDLINICSKWFHMKPNKMHKSIAISNGQGQLNKVSLDNIEPVEGRW
jgi:hypothetical protein